MIQKKCYLPILGIFALSPAFNPNAYAAMISPTCPGSSELTQPRHPYTHLLKVTENFLQAVEFSPLSDSIKGKVYGFAGAVSYLESECATETPAVPCVDRVDQVKKAWLPVRASLSHGFEADLFVYRLYAATIRALDRAGLL